MNLVEELEMTQLKQDTPEFRPGDSLRVWVKIKEGDKERLQAFEGVCIRRRGGSGASALL